MTTFHSPPHKDYPLGNSFKQEENHGIELGSKNRESLKNVHHVYFDVTNQNNELKSHLELESKLTPPGDTTERKNQNEVQMNGRNCSPRK